MNKPVTRPPRTARVARKTKETEISVELNLDGTGHYDVSTGIGFLDHMLEQLSRHSLIDLSVRAKGDPASLNAVLGLAAAVFGTGVVWVALRIRRRRARRTSGAMPPRKNSVTRSRRRCDWRPRRTGADPVRRLREEGHRRRFLSAPARLRHAAPGSLSGGR